MADAQNTEKILIVDDSPDTRELIERNIKSWGYHVLTACDAQEAIRVLDSTRIDVVVTDMRMPGFSGLDLIRHIRGHFPDIEVMMITGYGTIENAVTAIKEGASEYLCKPFTDEELNSTLERVVEKHRMRSAGSVAPSTPPPHGLIGESAPMRRIFSLIAKAASAPATVLISGESGTGKELVARAIHYSSARSSAPFVPVNCGGIPESLLESELFGYLKGSFTGAAETRAGFFLTADGGTIFLDEIGETSLAMQVKLLRVLQDKEVYMVGSPKGRKVDVRVIAATNKDLRTLVAKATFREDLYFRLNVVTLLLPPLRERGDDVLLLANSFARKYCAEFGRQTVRFSPEALEMLKNYSWPGNVRELENLIQRLLVMTESDEISADDFPPYMKHAGITGYGLSRTLEEVEAEHIRNVFKNCDGNKSVAARVLGIDRKTLREKLKRHGIEDGED